MAGIWDKFSPRTEKVIPIAQGSMIDPVWLLFGYPLLTNALLTALFLCVTAGCYLAVFRLVQWNRSTRHRLEENLDRMVTMKQFSEFTGQHHRVRTQMNHHVHMYGLLDEEVDRLRDDAKELLQKVVSAERALLPERLKLREQQQQQQQQQPPQKPAAVQRRRRTQQLPRPRQRPRASTSDPTSLYEKASTAPSPARAAKRAKAVAGPSGAS